MRALDWWNGKERTNGDVVVLAVGFFANQGFQFLGRGETEPTVAPSTIPVDTAPTERESSSTTPDVAPVRTTALEPVPTLAPEPATTPETTLPEPEAVWLTDLNPVDTGGGGPRVSDVVAVIDTVTYNHAVRIAASCQKGPEAWAEWELGRAWDSFEVTIGLSDESDSDATASLAVYVDTVLVDSGDLLSLEPPATRRYPVEGARRLRLEAIDPNGLDTFCGWTNPVPVYFGDALLTALS